MTPLALIAAIAFLPAHQTPVETAQFDSELLQMRFTYPKTWLLSTNKKSETRILIPVENSSERALVEIIPVIFRSDSTVWQLSQAGINKTLMRDVDRQWEEEILGVPLLLTKTSYKQEGNQKTTLTGLFYTLSPYKLMYRLTASPEAFDKADFDWKQALLSLRTTDGSLPKKEDPSVKIAMPNPKDDIPHPVTPHSLDDKVKVVVVKAPVAATVEISGHKAELHVPAGWTVKADKPGTFMLSSPGLSAPLLVSVASTLDSDPPATALFKASGASLDQFVKVNSREENMPRANRAGAQLVQIWRTGTSAKGELTSGEACGLTGEYYFLLTYRGEGAKAASERKMIEALVEQMSVEVLP